MVLASSPVKAQIVRDFTVRYQTTSRGDIRFVGNTLMTCTGVNITPQPPSMAVGNIPCATAQQDNGYDNSLFIMQYVDVDGDPSTFNSSSATLNLPANAQVLFAGLYWGAYTNPGIPNQLANRDKVLFKTPSASSYQNVTALKVDEGPNFSEPPSNLGIPYQGFADVFKLLDTNGDGTVTAAEANGNYTVANVQADTNAVNRFAGWDLVVVYRDTTLPSRSLQVYDGFVVISKPDPPIKGTRDNITITLTDFKTPASGSFTARLGSVVYEGDGGIPGETFNINGFPVSDPLNPVNDIFNGTITNDRRFVTNKFPNYQNQLGLDLDILNAPANSIANGATSVDIQYTTNTSREGYWPGLITASIDSVLKRAELSIVKSDEPDPFVLGSGNLTYTLTVKNDGPDPATTTVVTDILPTGLNFVSASSGCTQANSIITCNLGIVNPNETRTIKIVVTPTGTGTINNKASVISDIYESNEQDNQTPPISTTVVLPGAAVANKSVKFIKDNDNTGTLTVGDDVEYTIIVRNTSNVAIANLVIGDIVPTQLLVLRSSIRVDAGFVLSPNLPTNDFNGTGNNVTFTQPSNLPGNATTTLKYNARIRPGAARPISNQAVVNYTGNNGIPLLSDASDSNNPTQAGSGVNAGNAGSLASGGNINQLNQNNADLTQLNFVSPVSPSGSKSVRLVADVDGSNSVTTGDTVEYTITYINTTANPINVGQITDSIDGSKLQFAGNYSFSATPGTTVAANSNFNGTTDNKLTNSGTLAPEGSIIVKFRATVTAASGTQISNQASAQSNGNVNPSITDAVAGPGDVQQLLDDGINQGNLGATDDDDPTLLNVGAAGVPRLRLVKRVTNVTRNGIPLGGLNFGSFISVDANNDTVTSWPVNFLLGIPTNLNATPLQSGDEVEYTVYFLSDGATPVNNAKICDLIPVGTAFSLDSFGSGSGISLNRAGVSTSRTNIADADEATFLSPLAPLPALNACSNQTNPDGAVLANLGIIPNASGSNYGFIRFRVRVK